MFVDFNYDLYSLIFVVDGINVIEGILVCVFSWYDNEWGFVICMSDIVLYMVKFL